jgi:hypothetical protein
MYLLFCLIMVGLIHCIGVERVLTTLDSADKAMKAEYKRVDAKLHPDRKPLVYEPHVVKPRPRAERPSRPLPRKEGYVVR